jgi:nicotinate-nucleotide pyrophosphorylase (carboxylating)
VRDLDRTAVLEALLPALRRIGGGPEDIPEERTARASVIASGHGILAGLGVAAEAFGRVGVRLRPLAEDGERVERGDRVAEVGGPLRAILAVERVALGFLGRLSSLATAAAAGRRPATEGPLETYAVEVGRTLSRPPTVVDNAVSFSLETED